MKTEIKKETKKGLRVTKDGPVIVDVPKDEADIEFSQKIVPIETPVVPVDFKSKLTKQ